MSELGVSSVAVLEEEGGGLLSAISVTDVGQVGAERVDMGPVVDDEFYAPRRSHPRKAIKSYRCLSSSLFRKSRSRSRFRRVLPP